MSDTAESTTQVCDSMKCITCKFYESRSGFCRKSPPQVIVNSDGYCVTVFPKIAIPTVDYCFAYQSMTELKKPQLLI